MGVGGDEMVRGDSLLVPEQHSSRDSLVGTVHFDFHGVPHVVQAFSDADYVPIDASTFKLELDGFGIVYTCGTVGLGRAWMTTTIDSLNALIDSALRAADQPGFGGDRYKNCLPRAEHEKVQNGDGSWDITDVDTAPEFPGGYEKLRRHVAKVQQYPDSEYRAGVEGKVWVRFTVEEDGSLTDINILRSISWGLDNEAKRLIRSMPNWLPAKVKGKTVRCRVVLPINFKLETKNPRAS